MSKYKATIEVYRTHYSQEDVWDSSEIITLEDFDKDKLHDKIDECIENNTFESIGDFGLTTGEGSAKLISIDKIVSVSKKRSSKKKRMKS